MHEGVNRLSHLPPPSRHLHPFARGRRGHDSCTGLSLGSGPPRLDLSRESIAFTSESGRWCQNGLDSNPASATASLLELALLLLLVGRRGIVTLTAPHRAGEGSPRGPVSGLCCRPGDPRAAAGVEECELDRESRLVPHRLPRPHGAPAAAPQRWAARFRAGAMGGRSSLAVGLGSATLPARRPPLPRAALPTAGGTDFHIYRSHCAGLPAHFGNCFQEPDWL